MKKLYLFGNLKMNMDKNQLRDYLYDLKLIADKSDNVVGVAVPSCYLSESEKLLQNSKVLFGSQNVHYKDNGAYTGEISVNMLKDFGTKFSLVGHSERRSFYNETDVDVNNKVLKLLSENIVPILCVGETLSEKEDGLTNTTIFNQLAVALSGVLSEDLEKVIIAYEPVWAIGTGKSATPEEANETIKFIKDTVQDLFSGYGNKIVVLYGGSLNKNNATILLSQKYIDGGLIGGACLNAQTFGEIINTKIND